VRRHDRRAAALALLGYAALSFAYFGWPLVRHPGRILVGSTQDPQLYVWAFSWWPHAIASFTNPFVSHALYAPTGVNLTWTVSVPTLALAFSPLTALMGPTISYNVAALLMPALASWTAFLLCRRLTGSFWAAVIGGYLYGFSGSMLREEAWGNLHVTGIFLVPLFALVVVGFVRGELDGRGLAWRLGVLLALQLGISTEYAVTVTLMLAIGLALALLLVPDRRARLLSSLKPIGAGYALGCLLALPFLAYAAVGFVPTSIVPLGGTNTDLLNLLVPTQAIAVGGSTFKHLSSRFPDGGIGIYLGLPTLVIVVVYAARTWASRWTRFLVAALGVSALFALGSALQVDGHRLFALPWAAAERLPGLRNALPFRFGVYASLAAAVVVALWVASTRGRIYSRPYVLPLLAVAALVPAAWQARYHEHPVRVAFFTDGIYKRCLPPGETVTIFPFGGSFYSLLWQAETDFRFRLAEGGLQPVLKEGKALNAFDADPIVRELSYMDAVRPTVATLLAFAAQHHIGRFLVVLTNGYPSLAQLNALGRAQVIGGVRVSPGCGQPPLTTRNLTGYVEAFRRADGENIGYCIGASFFTLPASLYPATPAKHALAVEGRGLSCVPPANYVRRGFATPDMGVPAHTYPLYVPRTEAMAR
jgi:hypothetical protein